MIRIMSNAMRDTLDRLYRDVGMDIDQREAFNLRICKQTEPRTTAEGAKMVQALNAMLMARVKPYYRQFTLLVNILVENGADLNNWELQFLRDVQRKLGSPRLTPIMVKKTRQIAHKYDVTCGFPGFRELAKEKTSQVFQNEKTCEV
jgi:hypothetical protein